MAYKNIEDQRACYRRNYHKHKAKYLVWQRNRRLKAEYGITLDEYKVMFDNQDGKCFICLQESLKKTLSVDHNHATGKVRKLLCVQCNWLIGKLENSSNEVIDRAVMYSRTDGNQVTA